jgi:hypothetical protein
MCFNFFKIFTQNPLVLVFGFTLIFFGHDPHISDQLYITILYMSFY